MNFWTQFLGGMASAVVILGGLFALLNGYMVNKISSKVREVLDLRVLEMKGQFALESDLRNLEHNMERDFLRTDQEFKKVWSEMKYRPRTERMD
jgi:hypothetical protein